MSHAITESTENEYAHDSDIPIRRRRIVSRVVEAGALVLVALAFAVCVFSVIHHRSRAGAEFTCEGTSAGH